MATFTSPVSISIENEKNPWLAAAARFDEAARRLKLDDGMCKVLRAPAKEITVNIPVQLDDGRIEVFTGYRVQHSLARGPAKGGIRFAPGRDARRSARAGVLDDVEVRRGEHPVRRRQRRRDLRSQPAVRRGAGKADAALHRRDHRPSRPGARRAGAGRQHQRAGDGVDHGHLLHAPAPHRSPAVVTGKPMALGGSRGRPEATGRGCMIVTLKALKRLGLTAGTRRAW